MHKEPKEYFMDKLEEDIREVEEQMNELETKLEDSGWEPDMDLKKQIENIRLRLNDLEREVDRFESSGDTTWDTFKVSCEETLSEISRDAQELSVRLDKVLLE